MGPFREIIYFYSWTDTQGLLAGHDRHSIP